MNDINAETSSRVIWKYVIDSPAIALYLASPVVRHSDEQEGVYGRMWVEHDPSGDLSPVTYRVVGTGHTIPAGWKWVSSHVNGAFVWHIYEEASNG